MNDEYKSCDNCKHYDAPEGAHPCCDCVHGINYTDPRHENAPDLWESLNDVVNHPTHYETGNFECIDVMVETQGVFAVKAFCICNAFKYLYRHNKKNGMEDIKKAIWYLNKVVELDEGGEVNGDKANC